MLELSLVAAFRTRLPVQRGKFPSPPRAAVIQEQEDHRGPLRGTPKVSVDLMGHCCQSNVTVLYPLSGLSAVTGERVLVIQLEALKQPVFQQKCVEAPCRLLRGNCTQVYSPLALYVLDDSFGPKNPKVKLDFVLVEAGCRCQTSSRLPEDEISVGSLLGVDGTARQALNVMTGMSLVDQEVTAMSLGVPLVRSEEDEHNRQTITAAEELLLCHGPSESSHPEANEEHSTHHHINQGEKSSTPKPSAGEDIPAHHHVHQKNESSPTDETESTTRPPPPLPKLPETHNVPLRIPEGHFNPVLHSIQKFLT